MDLDLGEERELCVSRWERMAFCWVDALSSLLDKGLSVVASAAAAGSVDSAAFLMASRT